MKTIITAFILLGLTSCSEHKLDWQGDNPKPDTLVVDIKAIPIVDTNLVTQDEMNEYNAKMDSIIYDIKAMPLESDTVTY